MSKSQYAATKGRKFQLRLDDESYRQIEELCRIMRVSMAEAIRLSVRESLAARQNR